MTRIAIIAGVALGLGVWLLITGLRPAPPPRLDAALERLAGHGPQLHSHPPGRITQLADRLSAYVRIPVRDLDLLGMSAARYTTEKVLMALGGLLIPALLAALAAAEGATPSWTLPAGAGLILAVGGWFIPDLATWQTAANRRQDFRYALSAYFDVVRLGFSAGLGPSEALERAPHYSTGWAFQRIADAVDAARYTRIPPWQALAKLGDRVGVNELGDLADLAELAGAEGTRVVDAISAYTQQMRGRRLAELRYEAGSRTTTMTAPIALLGLVFVALVGFPQVYLLLNN